MRVISGDLKGRTIKFLKNSNTRPLKDSVKENIFNILTHSAQIDVKIENANILDLYSGVGSFGIECISRKAEKVTFIEQNKEAANILKENLTQLADVNKVKVFDNKIEDILKNSTNEKFNIFFFDPPFADRNYIQNLKLIKKNKMFKTNHIIIIHRERKTNDNFDNLINIIDTKQYGRSKIIFGLFN
jgi:16S rRNA (guanine966-N2)-methyltransferase